MTGTTSFQNQEALQKIGVNFLRNFPVNANQPLLKIVHPPEGHHGNVVFRIGEDYGLNLFPEFTDIGMSRKKLI
jgi:hypothetical protein